jgi:beta-N-acetylhexosaminidase
MTSLGPVMIDVEGSQLSADDKRRLLHPLIGGVILFTRNFSSYQQLIELTAEIRALRNPALLIAVDHEGGRVQRFQQEFTRLPAMRELGIIWDKNPPRAKHLAQQVGYILAAELKACGIDLSFTPVLDIDYGQSCIIGDRAFHRKPHAIADLAHYLMLGLKSSGMMAVGKHFPGHGFIQADTHLETTVDDRAYADIDMDDLIPFKRMIHFGLVGMMSAHITYPKIDNTPATFSNKWLKTILRDELQFEGCVFSDDLSMQAAVSYGGIIERAEAALKAGCDMILVCNNLQSVDELLAGLRCDISAVSLARIMRMHGKQQNHTIIELRESAGYAQAIREISSIGLHNQELPLL